MTKKWNEIAALKFIQSTSLIVLLAQQKKAPSTSFYEFSHDHALTNTVNERYNWDHYSRNDHYKGQIIWKTTVLEEIELHLFIGFEDTTALEDKKSPTVFSAIAVVVLDAAGSCA